MAKSLRVHGEKGREGKGRPFSARGTVLQSSGAGLHPFVQGTDEPTGGAKAEAPGALLLCG